MVMRHAPRTHGVELGLHGGVGGRREHAELAARRERIGGGNFHDGARMPQPMAAEALPVVGRGFCFEDLRVGFRFRTHRRTIGEADLASFVNLTWLTEELFAVEDDSARAIKGRAVPAALVYSFAEGLLLPTMQDTGLAFLNATLDVKGPTLVGDTIHVEAEVIEHRLTSKGDRGLVRFANRVVNQRGETVLEYNPLRLLKRK